METPQRNKRSHPDVGISPSKRVKATQDVVRLRRKAPVTYELKQYNSALSTPVTMSAGGYTIAHFPSPSQGDSDGQRDGNVIRVQRYNVRWELTPANASPGTLVRIIIFKWNDGLLLPTEGRLLDLKGASAFSGIISTYNVLYSDKYEILSDNVYSCAARTQITTGASYVPNVQYITMSKVKRYIQSFLTDSALYPDKPLCYYIATTDGMGFRFNYGLDYIDV